MKKFYDTVRINLILVFILFTATITKGQVASYTFSESTTTYTAIAGSTAIGSGWNDNVATTIPIGFTFNFNNTNYTTCTISSNGFITFGSTAPATTLYTPISSTTAYNGAICALGVDMSDAGTKAITYTTSGSSPNRIFTVQWDDARRLARSGNFDFQIKLSESTNTISIIYNNCAPTGTTGQNINVQVGLRGSSNSDFNNRSKTTHSSWATTTSSGTLNSSSCTTNSSSAPPNGLTFTWTPPPACTTPTTQPTALVLTPGSTTVTGSFTTASPAPTNYLVVRSNTNTAPSPTNGTSYTIGSTALGSGYVVVDNDTNTSFSDSGLTTGSTYYYFVFSFNSTGCTGGPLYNTTSPLSGSTILYCSPTGNLTCTSNDYISNVTLNTLNNTTTCNSGGYTNFSATGTQTTTLYQGLNHTLSLSVGAGSGTHGAAVWFDFNQNGVFTDAGEYFLISNSIAASSTTTATISIPAGASLGTTRMRVRYAYAETLTSSNSCTLTGTFGETEDYTVTIATPPACTAPTAQPTALILTPVNTTITGSFTAASPTPSNYLIVRNTSGITPTPTNTTTYTIGSTTLGGSNVVVDNDTNTSFSDSGLSSTTTYYYFIFSFNNSNCSGGPLYLNTSPLNGNATTGSAIYCTPTTSSSTKYINIVQSMGTLADVTSASATGYSTSGYGNYTAITIAEQVPGGPVNIYTAFGSSSGAATQYLKAYVDWNSDGDFVDTGELVYNSANVTFGLDTTIGFIVPSGQTPGNYRIRLQSRGAGITGEDHNYNACSSSTQGEIEDYTLKITADCDAKITTITDGNACGPTSSVTLTAAGSVGTIGYYWYTSASGGTGTLTSTGTYTTPVLAVGTTKYYVTAYNGTCESKTRTEIKATVKPVPSLTFSNPSPTVCGQDDIISLSATGSSEEVELLSESFENGLGTFSSSIPTATNAGTDSQWAVHTGPYQPQNTIVWKPAISSGIIGDKFALAVSDYSGSNIVTDLTLTNSLNTTNFTSLYIDFKHYYSFYSGDSGVIQASTDGGTTWNTIAASITASDIGTPASFVDQTVNLSTYINQANLKLRFRYTAAVDDGWAIDDVRIYGNKPLSPNFSWIGSVDAYTDAACTTAYTAGTAISTVYIKPTLTQLMAENYNITAQANLTNGCTSTKVLTVTNKSRVWVGGYGNDWNNEDNWSPNNGAPDANSCVIIPNGAISQITNVPTAYAKNVDVQTGGNLEIQANQNLIITDWIKTNGTVNVRNGANLIQVNNTPSPANSGTGSFNVHRTATGLKAYDYIYWSSPVANFPVTSVSPLSQTSRIYQWIPDINNGAGSPPSYGYGNWSNTTENMVAGKGYIIRVANTNPTFSTAFTGIPNNGTITKTITRGPYTGANYTGANGLIITNTTDNQNLMGNPYPSAIDAVEFLTANSGVIDGKVNLWTHGTAISNTAQSPYYQSYTYNYSSNDYVTYNSLGNNVGPTSGFNGKIAAGQGFFVEMLDGAAGSNTITFNNEMRTDASNNAYNNSQFYRTANVSIEKHRIWLDLLDSKSNMSRFMVGYATDATNGRDRLFDASTNYQEPFIAFSILDDEIFNIQGKAVPFDINDKINIGFQVPAQGTYKFAIADTDGLFADKTQKIYLEDVLTNTTHDLTLAPYSFTSDKGLFKNRFVLKYTKETLANENFEYDNSVIVYGTDNLTIKSELFNIKDVQIYDLLGKSLLMVKDVNTKENTFNVRNTNSALLVKITLENGAIVTKKVIY